jgi:O-acetyl-ADP-ribose deacetylase (regulator of RNase III)
MAEWKIGDRSIRLVLGDITDLEVEAFVYDITEDAKLGSGYGSAIASRGGKKIQEELDRIGSCPKGEAIATTAGGLKADRIIHVNGPKFHEPDVEGKLRRATVAALRRADELGIQRLALPPVGTGLYQVDLGTCARVMVDAVAEHLHGETSLREVLFVALDTRELRPLEAKIEQGARDDGARCPACG